MDQRSLVSSIKGIRKQDDRYPVGAYLFVLEALDFTARMLEKPTEEVPERHISGGELLDGIRLYALQEFGPMSMTVLRTWHIGRTEDFGEIVFNLVDAGKLRKTDKDTRADFAHGYDFSEAFETPFLPRDPPGGEPHAQTPPRPERRKTPRKDGEQNEREKERP